MGISAAAATADDAGKTVGRSTPFMLLRNAGAAPFDFDSGILKGMVSGGHRKRSIVAASVFGSVMIAVAIGLNIGWVVVNWRTGLLLVFGVLCFMALIAGMALNTAFLIREIRRNEQHDAFINAVTHELKTPVASIQLYLQTLQHRELERSKQEEFLDVMLADSQRLQSTIDQVLLAGKTGSSRRPLNRSDVNLTDIARECYQIASERHHLSDGELQFVESLPQGENAVIEGDYDEIKAAVLNLVDNAIKYSGERIEVVIEVAKLSARRAAIHVRDNGIGITSQDLKRVFRRFYRIPSVIGSRVKGTGLGLSIVLSVARRHGGKAYVESEGSGQGSTFTMELPLKTT